MSDTEAEGRRVRLVLNRPQARFLRMPHKFRAYVSGYRGGKTFVGSVARCRHFLENPGVHQGYFAPTYPQIRDIFFPTIEEVSARMGLKALTREANKEVHIFNGRRELGTIICRSMEKPESIVGFSIGDALADELDTLPIDKATRAWNKIIARMSVKRSGVRNGVDVTTTPEGFRFVYRRFFKAGDSSRYGLIQASTYDNERNLPDDYIPSLLETYPEELIEAYLNGRFVNLTSGSVYRNFDRDACASNETVAEGDTLHIGQDFNVGQMASVIHVRRGDTLHAVGEIASGLDTPAVCKTIAKRYPGHGIVVYPDASGANASSRSASTSDISILKRAGFSIRVRASNPRVRDRVLAMNAALEARRYRVNIAACPEYVECLEQQAYDKNGEPDKTTGHDHLNDAGTYTVAYLMPINRPAITPRPLAGMHG